MSCKFCTKVVYQNNNGKQFFAPMYDIHGIGKGDMCLAIDDCGRHTMHYEDDKNWESDMVDVEIKFCPICGRKLDEYEIDERGTKYERLFKKVIL